MLRRLLCFTVGDKTTKQHEKLNRKGEDGVKQIQETSFYFRVYFSEIKKRLMINVVS